MDVYQFGKKRTKNKLALDEDQAVELALDGKLISIPAKLFDKLEQTDEFYAKGRELAALQYSLVRSRTGTKPNGKKIHPRIHHKAFTFGTNKDTRHKSKKWLIKNKFIRSFENHSDHPVSGKSCQYKYTSYSEYILLKMNNLSRYSIDPHTNPNCQLCQKTRAIMAELQYDLEKIKARLKEEFNNITEKQDQLNFLRNASKISSITNNKGTINRGRLGNRLNSPFVNLKKEYRAFFYFNNKEMVNIDMVSAHPCLLGNISRDETLINDCITNTFYNLMPSYVNDTENKHEDKRQAAKDSYYEFAYGPIDEESPTDEFFKARYTKAYNYMYAVKEKYGYKKFSHEMQKAESELWIDTIFAQLVLDHKTKCLTIHDSIFAPIDNIDLVEQVIQNAMISKQYRYKLSRE